jgi:hypothetical protein
MGAGGEGKASPTEKASWQNESESDGHGEWWPRRRREPTGGRPLSAHTRSRSLERLQELADWKRVGLHDKYADETMVGGAGEAGLMSRVQCLFVS